MLATVFLVVPGGIAARLFLHTDILATLLEGGVRVVVLAPESAHEGLKRDVDREDVIFEPLRPWTRYQEPFRLSTARDLVRWLRRNALDGRSSVGWGMKYSKAEGRLRKHWSRRVRFLLDATARHLLWRSRKLRHLVLSLDLRLSDYREHADIFDRWQPELVVAPSLGYLMGDEGVLQEATKRGVLTAGVIHSWDNPTSQGYKAVDPSLVVAWSQRMRQEILRFHDVDRRRLVVGGVPHWDHYCRDGGLPGRDELFEELGLATARRLLVFATFVPFSYRFPNQELAETLAEAVESGEVGDDVQLLIRLHPKFMLEGADEARRAIQDVASRHEHVHVNLPETSVQGLDYPSPRDARVLGGVIAHSDVFVNGFSTTTLEACIVDRPVVLARPTAHLQGVTPQSTQDAMAHVTEFEHLRPVVASGAARIADDRAALIRHVRAYLRDPMLDRDARANLAREVCGPTDGYAGVRVGNFLLARIVQQAR
ncbi:MAG: hypothetical protein WKF96_05780 [Solirubrobacteraceae bacterium]